MFCSNTVYPPIPHGDRVTGSILGDVLLKEGEVILKEKILIFKIVCGLSPHNITEVKLHFSLSYSL